MAKLMVQFRNVPGNYESQKFGPYEWVQLTYTDLHVGEWAPFAVFGADGYWRIVARDLDHRRYTDVVIFPREERTDRFVDGHVQRRVLDLRVGDRVDLEGDLIADPAGDHPEFEFEFEVVDHIERETEDCIRVDFRSGLSCGFPPDHWVDVDGEQVRD